MVKKRQKRERSPSPPRRTRGWTIGCVVVRLREERGWRIEDFADISGLSRDAVTALEKDYTVNREWVTRAASAFKLTRAQLFAELEHVAHPHVFYQDDDPDDDHANRAINQPASANDPDPHTDGVENPSVQIANRTRYTQVTPLSDEAASPRGEEPEMHHADQVAVIGQLLTMTPGQVREVRSFVNFVVSRDRTDIAGKARG